MRVQAAPALVLLAGIAFLGSSCGGHPAEKHDAGLLPGLCVPTPSDVYKKCTTSVDEASCEANQGEWSTGPSGATYCRCATGQKECRCGADGQCLGSCIGEPAGEINPATCAALGQGYCSEWNVVFGCWCVFGYNGRATPICWD